MDVETRLSSGAVWATSSGKTPVPKQHHAEVPAETERRFQTHTVEVLALPQVPQTLA